MAITQTLKAKYPDWTQEDWDRFHWINSWEQTTQFSASSAMQTMWHCGSDVNGVILERSKSPKA